MQVEAAGRQEAVNVSRRALLAFCGIISAALGSARFVTAAEEASSVEAIETSASSRTPDTTITHKVLFPRVLSTPYLEDGSKVSLHAQDMGGESGCKGKKTTFPSQWRSG